MTRRIRNAVTLVVDGREVVAREGTMLVDAAKKGDVEIPVFCYEPKLGGPVGACRMCLVEIEGMPKLQTACSTPVRDGMVVYTQTDKVKTAQNAVVEFLLVNHPLDCPVCDKGGECPLQDIAMGWGPGKSRMTDPKRHFPKPLELSPLIAIDRERCILCYRCVRFSQEVSEDEQLQLLERGDRSYVGTFDERPYVAPFHGNIIELCPVGALTSYTYRFRARPWDIEQAGSVCTLCPSQCNVRFTVRDEKVMRTLARDNAEVDDGWLCDKGRFGHQMITSTDRITQPMVRGGDGELEPVSWDQAITKIASGLKAAGPATAAIAGGGTSNEEGWLLQKLMRDALASPHLTCSPSPLDGELLRQLSRPGLTARTSDIGYAGAILVVGADPLNEMPILDLRIRKAVRRSDCALSVATERPSTLDGGALEAVRYAPGQATGLLTGLASAIRGEQPEGSDAGAIAAIARSLKDVRDPMIVWGERLWREAGAVAALLDLARALDMAERIGPGLYEVPESSNARGLREVGMTGAVGPGLTAAESGKNADEICASLSTGELGAILLADANPVRAFPGSEAWKEALGKAFVVSIAMFDDETTSYADVVLPAESFAEKEGTVTHPDGRLQRLRPNVPLPDGTRPTWEALVNLANALGLSLDLDSAPRVFAALTEEVSIYAGATYEEIGGTGVRWQERGGGAARSPVSGAGPSGAEAGDTSGGDAPAPGAGPYAAAPAGNTEATTPTGGESGPASGDGASNGDLPNGHLLLGTFRDIWADGVAERNPSLQFLAPKQRVEIATSDAKAMGLSNGDKVTVSVNGSKVEGTVAIRDRMAAGTVFLMEGSAEQNANALRNGAVRTARVERA